MCNAFQVRYLARYRLEDSFQSNNRLAAVVAAIQQDLPSSFRRNAHRLRKFQPNIVRCHRLDSYPNSLKRLHQRQPRSMDLRLCLPPPPLPHLESLLVASPTHRQRRLRLMEA